MGGKIRLVAALLLLAGLVPSVSTAQAVDDGARNFVEAPAPGAISSAGPAVAASESDLEEIIVIGDTTLRGLREELHRAQDYVQQLFNELNDDDEYDIHCYMETRTGTWISQRVCKANFVDGATAAEGQAFLGLWRGQTGNAQLPAMATIRHKNDILRKKMSALVIDNADLREAMMRYADLIDHFDDARREILESRD